VIPGQGGRGRARTCSVFSTSMPASETLPTTAAGRNFRPAANRAPPPPGDRRAQRRSPRHKTLQQAASTSRATARSAAASAGARTQCPRKYAPLHGVPLVGRLRPGTKFDTLATTVTPAAHLRSPRDVSDISMILRICLPLARQPAHEVQPPRKTAQTPGGSRHRSSLVIGLLTGVCRRGRLPGLGSGWNAVGVHQPADKPQFSLIRRLGSEIPTPSGRNVS
jgi:hypothetical protein